MTRDIYSFQIQVCERLLAWSGLGILTGVLFILAGSPFWTGFGILALALGLLEAGIGFAGRQRANRRRLLHNPAVQFSRDTAQTSRWLRGSIWLGLGMLLAGAILVWTWGYTGPWPRGVACGLLIQGTFLVLSGWQHVLRVPSIRSINDLTVFADAKHSGFLWKSGRPAAVLVHGFPGTPNEIRSVAEALHENGWTVQGLLLPGFGPELDTLGQRKYEEWLEQVVCAVNELRREHSPVLLVGFSMGGALAVKAGTLAHPDGVVLLAPFLWLDSLWQRLLVPLVPWVLPPYVRPFRGVNFSNPYARSSIRTVISQVDIENHTTQKALRQLRFPLCAVGELRRAGLGASAALPGLDLPALVIQGRYDPLVRQRRTRRMLTRFPRKPAYLEVDGRHDLTAKDEPAWEQVRQAILDFARQLER